MKPIRYVYVAGPITHGDQLVNIRTAILAGEQLRAAGLMPFVPHWSALHHMLAPVNYEDWISYCLAWIERCDALVRLPGHSPGADREVVHATSRGLPTFYAVEALLANGRKEER